MLLNVYFFAFAFCLLTKILFSFQRRKYKHNILSMLVLQLWTVWVDLALREKYNYEPCFVPKAGGGVGGPRFL